MNQQARIIQVFGRRGTGKSNRGRNLFQKYNRILAVDRLCVDYSDGIIFENLDDLKLFWNKVVQGNFRLIYRPSHFDDNRLCAELDIIADWCMKCRNMTLLIEELNVIFDGQDLPKNLNTCVLAGRKRGIELITVSQRPKGYGKNILSQAAVFNVFHTSDPDDLRYFRDYMDDAALEAIRSLKEYEYLDWDFDRKDERMRVCKDEYIEVY